MGAGVNPLNEPFDEPERRVGDLAPAAVDGERVAAALDLDDLGHARVALLVLVGGVGDRPGDGVVLLAGDDQQWATLRVVGVDFGLGPVDSGWPTPPGNSGTPETGTAMDYELTHAQAAPVAGRLSPATPHLRG